MGFDPVTLGIMSLVTSVGGAVANASAQRQQRDAAARANQARAAAASEQAFAEARASAYRRSVAERNQLIENQKRQVAVSAARARAGDLRLANRRQLSKIRAAFGANGVDVVGTPLDIIEDSALTLETDVLREEHKGRVLGFESALQILGLQDDASMATMAETNALTREERARATGASAGSSGLGGVFGVVSAGISGVQGIQKAQAAQEGWD